MMTVEVSNRVKSLPPYLFVEIDRAKRKVKAEGHDVIDFGIGDPDQPTPDFIIKALTKALKDKTTHQYPLDAGRKEFRLAIAAWYKRRFNVKLDPETEILPLIGSKEGIAHLPLAYVNPGDKVLLPNPGYPAYQSGVRFAGGKIVEFPLLAEEGYGPDWKTLEKQNMKRVKIMYLNYPNNPTSAVATKDTFRKAIDFAAKNKIILCHDNAYSEIYYDKKPLSLMQLSGAKKVGIEFHSLSKTFNMTGWRIGFVCGNKDLIAGLAKVKSNIDSGVFSAIQLAGVEALNQAERFSTKMNALYKKRRDTLVDGLNSLGWNVRAPQAAFYVWCRIPRGWGNAMECSKKILDKAKIVVTPGIGFGSRGKNYVRFTLTVPVERIKEAINRLKLLR